MERKADQEFNPKRGFRWLVKTTGRGRIVWGFTKEKALAKAKLDAGDRGEEVLSIEPMGADHRNRERGGVKKKMLAIRCSEEELAAIREIYGTTPGRMSQAIIERLLSRTK